MSRKLRLVLGGNKINRKRRQYGGSLELEWPCAGLSPKSCQGARPFSCAGTHLARLVREVVWKTLSKLWMKRPETDFGMRSLVRMEKTKRSS
jgi:hypothetical protein